MQRRYSLAHFLLAGVIVLVLTLLMVCVDAQAQITFVSDRDGNSEIYVMDNDGGNPRRLTNNPDGDFQPSWSPDGKRIVFRSNRDGLMGPFGTTSDIYVMDADGGNQQRLTENPGGGGSPSWSPDGERIAFESFKMDRGGGFLHFDIYVMDADEGNPQNLTNNNPDNDQHPSWSPDGKRIVFSSQREGHFIGDFGTTSDIYVMDANESNQQRLTKNRQYDWNPVWSPDGERIAFESARKGDLQNLEIYVMDADGGNQQRLTENRVHDGSPSWSPDGERIAFESDRKRNSENFEIYVMDNDGGNQQKLTNHPRNDGSPAWFVPAFAVAPAGKKFTMWGWLKQIDR